MQMRFILPLILLGLSDRLFAGSPIPAAIVTWAGPFGASETAPHSSFCLMARGFFRAPTSPQLPEFIATWLKDHPKAVVVPVATFGAVTPADPDSKMVYVWVIEGEHNLNLELTRTGCISPATQTIAKGQKLEVNQADYDAWVQRVTDAGKTAQAKKLGIWLTLAAQPDGSSSAPHTYAPPGLDRYQLEYIAASPEQQKNLDAAISAMKRESKVEKAAGTMEEAAALLWPTLSIPGGMRVCTEYKGFFWISRLDWAREDDGSFKSGYAVKKGTGEIYRWQDDRD